VSMTASLSGAASAAEDRSVIARQSSGTKGRGRGM
jgi:hypothetical protein